MAVFSSIGRIPSPSRSLVTHRSGVISRPPLRLKLPNSNPLECFLLADPGNQGEITSDGTGENLSAHGADGRDYRSLASRRTPRRPGPADVTSIPPEEVMRRRAGPLGPPAWAAPMNY